MKLLWALLLTASAASAAPVIYNVSIDLSGYSAGTSGLLDLQFNPAVAPGTPGGTAVISVFNQVSSVLDELTATADGGVSGNLIPGALTMLNSTIFNAYLVPFTINGPGALFSFTLTLDGPMLTPPGGNTNGTTFAIGLLTPTFDPLNGVNPVVGSIDVDALGAITTASLAGTTLSAVPEPSTMVLLGLSLVGLGMLRRRKP